MTWLKKIGCTGPSRFVAMGRTLAGSYGGCAIVRTYWMISSICRSLSCGLNGGMSEESPTACGPSEMARCRNSSVRGFMTAPTVRSWGLMVRLAPPGPSPLPDSPWHEAQYWPNICWPRLRSASSCFGVCAASG